jgi:hypothetical protein
MIRQEIEFEIDIKDVIDFEFETSYAINKTQYSQANFSDRQTNSLSFQLRGRNYFFKDLTLGYDLRKTLTLVLIMESLEIQLSSVYILNIVF